MTVASCRFEAVVRMTLCDHPGYGLFAVSLRKHPIHTTAAAAEMNENKSCAVSA